MAAKTATDEPAGMDRGALKQILRLARNDPVQVAFAIGGDGKAIIQMDRRKPGRALEKLLKDADPQSKNHRWGTAAIAPDDVKTVRFTVNKAGGGLARKLVVALKGTGVNKVKVLLDDGTELEADESPDTDGDDDDRELPAAPAASSAPAAANPINEPPAGTAAREAGLTRPAPTLMDNPASPREAENIRTGLANAVRSAQAKLSLIPGLAELLKTAAPAIEKALGEGDIDTARQTLAELVRKILSPPPDEGGDALPPEDESKHGAAHAAAQAPTIETARKVWGATRAKIAKDVDKLHATFGSALEGHAMSDDLVKTLRGKVDASLEKFDERLLHALDRVNKAGNAKERARLVRQAKLLVLSYQKQLASDPTIKLLDENPFTPLAIGDTVTRSLAQLQKTIS